MNNNDILNRVLMGLKEVRELDHLLIELETSDTSSLSLVLRFDFFFNFKGINIKENF